tara:strand:- start:1416 stop:2738 length:1323 start_codon:yes stop_codon:yes gene_type:complete
MKASTNQWGPSPAGLPEQQRGNSASVSFILIAPLIGYIASLWLVRPLALGDTFSLTLLAPALMLVGLLTIRVPRQFVLNRLSKVGVEFSLLVVIVILSFMSMVNAEEPIRAFRIIYPGVLPGVIFLHLVVVCYIAPNILLKIPRYLIISAVIFSVIPLILSMVVGPLRDYLFVSYRMRGFFENSIQHSIALGVMMPLVVVELSTAKKKLKKVAWACLILIMVYTTFQAGSKSVMVMSSLAGLMLFTVLEFRSRNFFRISAVLIGLVMFGLFMWAFGLTLAEKINPTIAEKLRSIIEGGVSNYQSIESRKELWREAMEQGKRHWLIGTGAGEKVLGISHSHNLVLDYFKGIGVFGAASIAFLCLTILSRTAYKTLWVLRGLGGESDIRILGCYFGASLYVICNQLSDCFGPSTVGFLWIVYLAGRMSEGVNTSSGDLQSSR